MRMSHGLLAGALLLAGSMAAPVVSHAEELLPPDAKPGECYARIFIPPTYETETETVVKREASERVEVVPAEYAWAEERVLVKEASQRLEVVPPAYEWAEEQVLVKPASTRIEEVPAEYGWVEEQVLEKPAHTIWKKGKGPIQRVDHATGEILCLVEVPAEYKMIRKRVVKTPATTRKVEIPAEYKMIRKRVVKTPATTRTVEIPAEYKTVKVMKMVKPAEERRVPIPAETDTITRRKKVTDGRVEWQAILCETNATEDMVTQIQRSLQSAGFDPGPIDGEIGPQTMHAVEAFQRSKGLPTGGLTTKTLQELGVGLRTAAKAG